MNIFRTDLDGIFRSVFFNINTALILKINPVIFTTSYPKEIQKLAPRNPHFLKHKILFSLFLIIPVTALGIISSYIQGEEGFWNFFISGYIQCFLINLGDFSLLI